MIVETTRFGKIELLEENIYSFVKGIPGFEEYTKFAGIDIEGTPFSHLQSVENGNLALIVVDPFVFYSTYEFQLPDSVVQELEIETPEHIDIRCVVTVRDSLEKATVNLLAPIVLNIKNKKGKQVVLHQSDYTTKHPLISSVKSDPSGKEG